MSEFLPKLIGTEGLFRAEVLAWTDADAVLIISYYIRMARINKRFSRDR